MPTLMEKKKNITSAFLQICLFKILFTPRNVYERSSFCVIHVCEFSFVSIVIVIVVSTIEDILIF